MEWVGRSCISQPIQQIVGVSGATFDGNSLVGFGLAMTWRHGARPLALPSPHGNNQGPLLRFAIEVIVSLARYLVAKGPMQINLLNWLRRSPTRQGATRGQATLDYTVKPRIALLDRWAGQ